MAPTTRMVVLGLAIVVAAVISYDAVRVVRALRISEMSVGGSRPFTARPSSPTTSLLVLGDSTAVGAGAAHAAESVAGRIAADFPHTLVDNEGRIGARVRDLAAQLASVSRGYDVLLVQVGGNDILRFTPLAHIEREFDAFLADGTRVARHVAVIAPGLVGDAPAIPWPLSVLYNLRSRQVRERLATVAVLRNVHFVDLEAGAATGSPFARDPERNYAADGLHPSGNGYGHWYDTLAAQVPLDAWLGEVAVEDGSARRHHG